MSFKLNLDKKTLAFIDKIFAEPVRNPAYRYWGGAIEYLYETWWGKMNKAWDDSEKFESNEKEHDKYVEKAHVYSDLIKLLIERYPHVDVWSDEMIGLGCKKLC